MVKSIVAEATDTSAGQHSRHKKRTQEKLAESDIQSTASAYTALHVQLIEKHGKQQHTPNDQSVLWQSQHRLALLQVVLLVVRLVTMPPPPNKAACMVCVKVAMALKSIAAENMLEVARHSKRLTTKESGQPTAADASAYITWAHDAACNLSVLLLPAWMHQLRQCLKPYQTLISPTQLFPWLQVIMADSFPGSKATTNTFLKHGKFCQHERNNLHPYNKHDILSC